MNLSARERKLLILALDRAAHSGESDNAAIALVRSLKVRFGDGYKLLAELQFQSETSSYPSVDYGNTILPFGKHRGRKLKTVPPNYLLWILENCSNLDGPLRMTISRYLRDRQFSS